MNENGWVKLWREQFSHSLSDKKPWCDGYAWCYLYSQANFKKGIVNFRNEYIEIERGQFLTSQLKLAGKWGWTRKHVKTFLNSLEKDKMLTIRTTNRFIVITIINYDIYQSRIEENGQQNGQQERNRSATEAQQEIQQKDTIEEVKKEKKEKKRNTLLVKFEFDDLRIAHALHELMKQNNPNVKVSENQLNKWADTVRLMREQDKRTHDDIETVIEWSQRDEFWKANILSMDKLRKKFDQLWIKSRSSRKGGADMSKAEYDRQAKAIEEKNKAKEAELESYCTGLREKNKAADDRFREKVVMPLKEEMLPQSPNAWDYFINRLVVQSLKDKTITLFHPDNEMVNFIIEHHLEQIKELLPSMTVVITSERS